MKVKLCVETREVCGLRLSECVGVIDVSTCERWSDLGLMRVISSHLIFHVFPVFLFVFGIFHFCCCFLDLFSVFFLSCSFSFLLFSDLVFVYFSLLFSSLPFLLVVMFLLSVFSVNFPIFVKQICHFLRVDFFLRCEHCDTGFGHGQWNCSRRRRRTKLRLPRA